jgi:hypothetical protein
VGGIHLSRFEGAAVGEINKRAAQEVMGDPDLYGPGMPAIPDPASLQVSGEEVKASLRSPKMHCGGEMNREGFDRHSAGRVGKVSQSTGCLDEWRGGADLMVGEPRVARVVEVGWLPVEPACTAREEGSVLSGHESFSAGH